MKVFLSWSGDRSKQVAEVFHGWLQSVIQALEPWLSGGIEKGSRWSVAVEEALSDTAIGIFCLTSENLNSKWLHFEAGALAKGPAGRVCTFLLDVTATDVEPPLSIFQATAFTKEDVLKLVLDMNALLPGAGEKALDEARLRSGFEHYWPEFENQISQIKAAKPPSQTVRSTSDMMQEVVSTVREMSARLEGAVVSVPSVGLAARHTRWPTTVAEILGNQHRVLLDGGSVGIAPNPPTAGLQLNLNESANPDSLA